MLQYTSLQYCIVHYCVCVCARVCSYLQGV